MTGGIGGSGTRVLFRLLKASGYYLGNDLNPAGDNLLFTLMFKRPDWYVSALKNDPGKIRERLVLFHKCMTGAPPLSPEETACIFNIAHEYEFLENGKTSLARIRDRMQGIHDKKDVKKYTGWGWKEPNAFIFLKHLSRFYPGLKYIHLIRHGLDMAFSSRNQYRFWTRFFGLDRKPGWKDIPEPAKKAEYWLRANAYACEQGSRLLGHRFHVIRFDDLCDHPTDTIDNLLDFLGIGISHNDRQEEMYAIPRPPQSRERYKKHDLDIFSAAQMEGIRNWGFEITSS